MHCGSVYLHSSIIYNIQGNRADESYEGCRPYFKALPSLGNLKSTHLRVTHIVMGS